MLTFLRASRTTLRFRFIVLVTLTACLLSAFVAPQHAAASAKPNVALLHLSFTDSPTSVTAGQPFGVQVSVLDTANLPLVSFNGSISLALKNGTCGNNAALGGNLSVQVQNGVATFTNLSLNKAATGCVLTAANNSLVSIESTAFDVVAGLASHLAYVSQPTTTTAGQTISPFAATVLDAFDNVVTTSADNLHVIIKDGTGAVGAVLEGTTTNLIPTNGVFNLSNLVIKRAGLNYVLVIVSNTLNSIETNVFTITPAAATGLAFTTQPGAAHVGTAFGTQPALTMEDTFGNTVTSFSGNVSVAIKSGTGTTNAALSGTTTVVATNGVAQFTNLAINSGGTGYVLSATSGAFTTDSASFGVTQQVATHLVFGAQPSGLKTNGVGTKAGTPLAFQPSLTVADAQGGTVTGYTGNVTLAIKAGSGTVGATLGGTTTLQVTNGVANFTNLSLSREGVGYVLVATSGTISSAESAAFDIMPSGSYVQTEMRTANDLTISTTAPVLNTTITIRNMTGVTLPANTPVTFSFKGLAFSTANVLADSQSLTGGAKWLRARTSKAIATLNNALADGESITLNLHIVLTKAVPGKRAWVKMTMVAFVGRKITFSSNAINPMFAATSTDSGTHGVVVGLAAKMPKNGKGGAKSVVSLSSALFANKEMATVTVIAQNGSATNMIVVTNGRGLAQLKLKGLTAGVYTVRIHGWMSGLTATTTITLAS